MNEVIESIDKYWRAANYITVSNMYLKKVIYPLRELKSEEFRECSAGHWGTSPGINFIYAHLNRYVKDFRRVTQLIVGPGHGGNALYANLCLEENDIIQDLNKCNNYEKHNNLIRTEINPYYPGAVYDGGELGYSLAVAYGTVLDMPGALCVCIIGDGEAETGTISAAWNCKDYFDNSSGFVLPILHLNNYRMGGKSILSEKSDVSLYHMFMGYGYTPIIVHSNHIEMYNAFNEVERLYKEIERGEHSFWPIIILRSPKGWTAPKWNGLDIENTMLAHKDPLKSFEFNSTREYIFHWLKSYNPDELFNPDGTLGKDALAILPQKEQRLGNALQRYKRKKVILPNIERYEIKVLKGNTYRSITAVRQYLEDVIRLNHHKFRIVSPDELQSNMLASLKTVNCITKAGEVYSINAVMEILNENICQAWMQGYTLTGRSSLMISYEAFMPIVSSMVSQYAKWLIQSEKIVWREQMNSLTYLLTSVCWENTYSHQNPEFISSILSQQMPFARIYMPVDANSLLAALELSIKSIGRINIIVSAKQKLPQLINLREAKEKIKCGVVEIADSVHKIMSPDIVLVAAGDYPAHECMEARKMLLNQFPELRIRLLLVLELTSVGASEIYPHAISEKDFLSLFTEETPIVFSFHGFPTAVKMLLFDRLDCERITILGYDNKSYTSDSTLRKMIFNHNSRYDIAMEAIKMLYKHGSISGESQKKACSNIKKLLE